MGLTIAASVTAVTAWVAVLLLAGLLLIFLMLRSRLDSLEQTVASLRDEIGRLARRELPPPPVEVPSVDLGPLEARLDEVRDLLAALEGQHGTLEGRLDLLSGDLLRERGVRLQDAIERRLRGHGYESVRVLGDLTEVAEEPVQISVEAYRRGTTHKGFVVIEHGQIVDEKLSSSYEAFP